MSFYEWRVSDVIADQEEATRRGLLPAEWPISGDDLTRYQAMKEWT